MISLKLISEVIFNQRDVDEISCLHLGSLALLLLAVCLGSTCGVWSAPTGFHCEYALSTTSQASPPHPPTFLAPCSTSLTYLPIAYTYLKNRSGIIRFFMSSGRELDAHLDSDKEIFSVTQFSGFPGGGPRPQDWFGGNLAAIR